MFMAPSYIPTDESQIRQERERGRKKVRTACLDRNVHYRSVCVCVYVCVCVHLLLLPEAACSVAQHLRGMKMELAVVMVIGGGVPVRVGYDDTVGEDGQGVLDDRHLQSVT